MGAHALQLDPTQRSLESRDFESGLRRKIVGQDEAVQAVVDLYQVFRAGLNSPGRPVGNLLFLGPYETEKPPHRLKPPPKSCSAIHENSDRRWTAPNSSTLTKYSG